MLMQYDNLSSAMLGQGYRTVNVEQHLELARWSPDTALLVGGVLTAIGVYAVIWLYRHEKRGKMSRGFQWTLTGVRLLVLCALGFIGLEPVLVHYEDRRLDARTLVLVDRSASMDLEDHYHNEQDLSRVTSLLGQPPAEGLARKQIAESLLADGSDSLVEKLAAENMVRVMAFDRGVESVAERGHSEPGDDAKTGGPIKLESSTGNGATDLGHAVRRALEGNGDAPLAGLVILTDGGFNRGETDVEVARMLNARKLPTYVVGVGDPADPINIRVSSVTAPRSVFKNDPFSVTINLESEGQINEPVRVSLFERRDDDTSEQLIAERQVSISGSGPIEPVAIERKVESPGEVAYRVSVAPIANESILLDNARESTPRTRILDDKLKVLLIAGAPSYDYRFLMRLLERDETVELSTWLQSADVNAVRDGNVVITEFPVGTEKLNAYDAIILMDVDPAELDPTWGSIVSTYVSEYGGGLIYAAGNKYTGRFFRSPKTRPILAVLPVVPDPEAEIIINELGHFQTKSWPIVIPPDSVGDAILAQDERADISADIWAMLGGVYWHYPVRREKPVAKALMRHSNPRMVNAYGGHVLLATQYVGAGRSAYLGINTTWRWRKSDEKPFNRFWIQLLRFAVEGKLAGGRSFGQVTTGKDTYEAGESVVVSARLLNERYEPLLLPEVSMKIEPRTAGSTEDGSEADVLEIVLTPVAGREGHYEGRFQARDAGAYRLSINRPEAKKPIEREIFVEAPNLEMRNTAMRRGALQAFAKQIGVGSRYFDIDEAMEIPALIPDSSRTTRFRGNARPIWDNGYVLGILIGLLCVEWALRKVARLI